MHKVVKFTALSLAIALPQFAQAEPLHVLRPLLGFTCMALNITEQQGMDPSFHVPLYTEPNSSSQVVGFAALQVAVKSPAHIVNGFEEAMFQTGTLVWIKADLLRSYHSLSDPAAKCVPAVMSNGRQGFDYTH